MEKHFCYYCGAEAKFQLKNGKWCCCESSNSCPAIKKKNSDGLKKAYREGKIDAKKIYSNKSDEAKRKQAWSNGKLLFSEKEVFCHNSKIDNSSLKKYLLMLEKKKNKCDICGIDKWNEKPLSLQVHHKDGNPRNNVVENLQLLCPNCHSQTDTFSGRNKKKFDWNSISIDKLKSAARNSKNYRQLLIELGCYSICSDTYKKITKLCCEYQISLMRKEEIAPVKTVVIEKIKKRKNKCLDCGIDISNYASRCKKCASKRNTFKYRKVKRPDKETLKKEVKENSFLALSRKYGVSDNAIRKWCVGYGINYKNK